MKFVLLFAALVAVAAAAPSAISKIILKLMIYNFLKYEILEFKVDSYYYIACAKNFNSSNQEILFLNLTFETNFFYLILYTNKINICFK